MRVEIGLTRTFAFAGRTTTARAISMSISLAISTMPALTSLIPLFALVLSKFGLLTEVSNIHSVKVSSWDFVIFRLAYLASTLGGVSLRRGEPDDPDFYIAEAKAWLMVYHLKFYPENVSLISGMWEKVPTLFVCLMSYRNVIFVWHSKILCILGS